MTDAPFGATDTDNVVELARQSKTHHYEDVAVLVEQDMVDLLTSEIRDALNPNTQTAKTCQPDLYPEDTQSIQSERLFRERFGFALGKRGRLAVIKFMDDYDLTSNEVRALYGLGSMTWDGSTLRLRYVFWFKLLGVSQMLGLLIILIPALLVLFQNVDAHWFARLVLLLFSSALILGMAWVYRSYILPFKALKRRRA